MKNDIKYTKKRLALIFACLVFIIAFILELFYFSYRYIRIDNIERSHFNHTTNQFIYNIENNQGFINSFTNNRFRGNNFGQNRPRGPDLLIRYLSFIIISEGDIVLSSLNEEINITSLDNLFNDNGLKNGTYYRKYYLADNDKIIFFKNQSYTLNKYITDLLTFFIFNILFSFVFYFIGYYFSSNALKPIEKNLNDMKEFIENSTHELKTPLGVINSNMQLLKSLKSYDSSLVNSSISEVKRIDNLILTLINLSLTNTEVNFKTNNIKLIIDEVINDLNSDIINKGINISFIGDNDIIINSNREELYIIFSNIIHNAVKYNIQDGSIIIEIKDNILYVKNSYNKDIKIDYNRVFDRFYKGDNSRNTTGYGIGLSLVKKICDKNNYKIDFYSKDHYIVFKIDLL